MTEPAAFMPESISEQYVQHTDGLAAAADRDNEEREAAEADSTLESVDQELPLEALFVAGGEPGDDLDKDRDGVVDGDMGGDGIPDIHWLKDDIINYTLTAFSEDGITREELEGMTKAEIIDRFYAPH
jgi:hypothetical protein